MQMITIGEKLKKKVVTAYFSTSHGSSFTTLNNEAIFRLSEDQDTFSAKSFETMMGVFTTIFFFLHLPVTRRTATNSIELQSYVLW